MTIVTLISLIKMQILLIQWPPSHLQSFSCKTMQTTPSKKFPKPLPFTVPPPRPNHPSQQLRSVMPILRSLARNSHSCPKLPLLRVLTAMAKLFQLTHIEALFLVYLVEQTRWNFKDPLLKKYSPTVRDVLYTYVCDQPQYKNLVLYLALACFSLKESLTDRGIQYKPVAQSICPFFGPAYEQWSQKYAGYTSMICPELLNNLYRKHAALINSRREDFMAMTDEIIQIASQYQFIREIRKKIASRINKDSLQQAQSLKQEQKPEQTLPFSQKHEKKLEIQFQSKFFSQFAQGNISKLVAVGTTTNDYDDDFMFGREEEEQGIEFLVKESRAHSDPLSQDEQCEEESLLPLYEERALELPHPQDLSRSLQLASIGESDFGIFAIEQHYDFQ